MPDEIVSRTMWMLPRDKRHQWALALMGQLRVLRAITGSSPFGGNQCLQDEYIKELENQGLKEGETTKQVENSGGARTYLARFRLLGLIFEHENIPYLTLAGEAIANGENPLEVLRHQMLSIQYPCHYSASQNVKIDPSVKVKPVQFIISLLSDPTIQTLTQLETIIPIVYGRNNGCLDICKDKILKLRTLNVSKENTYVRYKAIGNLIDNDNPSYGDYHLTYHDQFSGCDNPWIDVNSDWQYLGTYVFEHIEGCTDPNACNFNPEATLSNGSCAEEGSV